jgi:hypothetical protein
MGNRFEHLEGDAGLSDDLKVAIAKIARFDHLEIGGRPSPAAPAREPDGKFPCPGCGRPNEPERESCWACHQVLIASNAPAAGATPAPRVIEIVVDGVHRRSDDADLPEDVRELLNRIAKEGYSERLMSEWTEWRHKYRSERLLKGSSADPAPPYAGPETDPPKRVKILHGRWVSVITVDGKTYKSDDAVLSPEMRQLFDYIEKNGVTPALVAYIERFGRKVDVGGTPAGERPAPAPQPWIGAETARADLQAAQDKLEQAKADLLATFLRPRTLIVLGLSVVYLLFRMFASNPR